MAQDDDTPTGTNAWENSNVAFTQEAIDLQKRQLHLEEGQGESTDVFHLLFAIRRYCHARQVPFDAVLENVKSEENYILG